MNRRMQVKDLKEKINDVMNSKKDKKEEIITVIVETDLFLEMAYCFIAKHGE